MASKHALFLLGKVVPSTIRKAVEIQVPRKVLDEYIRMYFSEWTTYFALDHQLKCKPGDIVLIKELNEPLSKDVTHEVKEIVFARGNIIDPISGKKCVKGELVEDIEYKNLALGGRMHPKLEVDHSEHDLSLKDKYPQHLDTKLVD